MPTERDRLVEANVGVVRSIASTIARGLPIHVPLDDLVAAGMRGLIEAADRYDASRGVAFVTFAYYRVRGAVFDEIRKMAWLPRRTFERTRFLEKVDEIAEDAVPPGAPPRGADAAQVLAKTLSEMAVAYVATVEAFESTASLEAGPEAKFAGHEEEGRVRIAISKLPEKERTLLVMHYFEDASIQAAGERLGLSKSWASRLHTRALRLLGAQLSQDLDR